MCSTLHYDSYFYLIAAEEISFVSRVFCGLSGTGTLYLVQLYLICNFGEIWKFQQLTGLDHESHFVAQFFFQLKIVFHKPKSKGRAKNPPIPNILPYNFQLCMGSLVLLSCNYSHYSPQSRCVGLKSLYVCSEQRLSWSQNKSVIVALIILNLADVALFNDFIVFRFQFQIPVELSRSKSVRAQE